MRAVDGGHCSSKCGGGYVNGTFGLGEGKKEVCCVYKRFSGSLGVPQMTSRSKYNRGLYSFTTLT